MIKTVCRLFGSRTELYRVLRVGTKANRKEIREAYHRLAKQYHPDLNPDPNARQKFEEVKMYVRIIRYPYRAYDTLINDKKRSTYDFYRAEADEIIVDASGKVAKPINAAKDGTDSFWTTSTEREEFKETVFNEFDYFYKFSQPAESFKGENIEMELKVSLQEIAKDEPYRLKVNKKTVCEQCKGKKVEGGKTEGLIKCYECRGTGRLQYPGKPADFFGFKLDHKCPKCNGLSFLSATACKYFFL
eukprot:TRINITY_DN89859_c0_g1_i1.p2 TRINITY_DN89859_c0_g1~~TRINITY_DN89859_c0_g1_i1.p2  ORF type:complete len:245 (-),score=35.55 TRINITY_DN89859_c0_g1_i1:633-1367(-)